MELKAWLKNTSDVLSDSWGLASDFADSVALFLAYCYYYQLNPVVTSGYRSEEKQKTLLKRYQAGDRSIVVKPAATSLHSKTSLFGNPASRAIDVSTSNPSLAAQIAKAVGLGAGYYFKSPDRVHFFDREAV